MNKYECMNGLIVTAIDIYVVMALVSVMDKYVDLHHSISYVKVCLSQFCMEQFPFIVVETWLLQLPYVLLVILHPHLCVAEKVKTILG